MQSLKRVFELSTPSAVAAGIGVSQSLPHMWLARGSVPVQYRPAIERFVDGRVTVEDFGPDVVWHRIKDQRWPHPAGRPLADFAASLPPLNPTRQHVGGTR